MYIKSIVLDGFKSYGQRTEINGFDPSFNAITGLNGSGKSNILDAICFVLGITNLKSVRASSLQDLIYKQGQGTVNRATVSVIFDNADTTHSPHGYEDQRQIVVTRQVVIGGKNKYLINGITVQNKRVQDLFSSVQLNVNNPHFLIMQGRITKVLNMKPMEILAMVEEAAGTGMYKSKREASSKTLEKKDEKMREMNTTLKEDLLPKIDKLRKERQQYQEFIKLMRESDQLNRICLAYKFFEAEKACEDVESQLQEVETDISNKKNKIKDGKVEVVDLQKQIKEIQEKRDQEGSGQLEQAEKNLSEAEKQQAKLQTREKATQDNLKSEVRKRQQTIKGISTDENLLKKKEATLEKEREEYSLMEEQTQKLTTALEDASKRHQAASMGLFVDEHGKASSLQQQLIDAQKAMISAQGETKSLQMKVDPLKAELKAKQAQLRQAGGNKGQEQAKLQALEKNIAALQKEVEKLQPSLAQEQEITARIDVLTKELRQLDGHINNQLNSYPRARFEFKDPEPNFDRNQVKGLVCRLFKVKDPSMATALENVAGGRLYNVITSNDIVPKKLIKGNCVATRVTYMPLNKITSYTLSPQVISAAQRISGADNVWYALDLIDYAPELRPAMEAVFGSTLICRDLSIAKVLPYDNRVKARCVTLDGDIVEPSGTMSGGAAARSKPILAVLAGLQKQQEKLDAYQAEYNELTRNLRQVTGAAERCRNVQSDLDMKNHESTLLKTSIAQSEHGRLELELTELEQEIGNTSARMAELKQVEQTATQKHKELETKVKQSKALADKELKAAEKEMKQLQSEIDKGRQKWEQCEQKFKTLELEIQELKTQIETARAEIETSEANIKKMEEDIETGHTDLDEAKTRVSELQEEVHRQKELIKERNREMTTKMNRVDQLTKEAGEIELALDKLQNTKEKVMAESKAAQRYVQKMIEQHEWIQQERKKFNQPGTAYDFKNIEIDKAIENLAAVETRKKTLEKKTNMQAIHILAKAEEQLNDLLKKKDVVEKDRKQLQVVIDELDKKMVEVLQHAWQQINKDFGNIFSTLLKGADAKLVSSSGDQSPLKGLEVKVGFNGKWKDSLGELSGGQRSLVALSLILAMLHFKPAPIYILDEVDAALDASHTENIGNIIQTHFKQSQFVIVSLKDGMFSNANVLFRTQFVDGKSTVSRTVQQKKAVRK